MIDDYYIDYHKKGVNVEILEIDGVNYYLFPAAYFYNELQAMDHGYFWDDEIEKWTKTIEDDSTTIF